MSVPEKIDPLYAAKQYLARSGISGLTAEQVMEAYLELQANFTPSESAIWSYKVPVLSEDGSCSLIGELAEQPFELASRLEASENSEQLLRDCSGLVELIKSKVGCDWYGIYKAFLPEPAALVKLTYYGIESRAEFPLSEEFAEKSNNSQVGLSGRAVLIEDLTTHAGAYYNCDHSVLSEACLPIYSSDFGLVVGIIDAEDHAQGFFHAERLSYLVASCIFLSGRL